MKRFNNFVNENINYDDFIKNDNLEKFKSFLFEPNTGYLKSHLHNAIKWNAIKIFTYLIDNFDVNFYNNKSLFNCVKYQRYDMLKMLLEKGVEINFRIDSHHIYYHIFDVFKEDTFIYDYINLLLDYQKKEDNYIDKYFLLLIHKVIKDKQEYLIKRFIEKNVLCFCNIYVTCAISYLVKYESLIHTLLSYISIDNLDDDCIKYINDVLKDDLKTYNKKLYNDIERIMNVKKFNI